MCTANQISDWEVLLSKFSRAFFTLNLTNISPQGKQ